jgi:hypothetical protein
LVVDPFNMNQPDHPPTGTPASTRKPSRLAKAQRVVIEEYADDLREVIRKLRRHLQ